MGDYKRPFKSKVSLEKKERGWEGGREGKGRREEKRRKKETKKQEEKEKSKFISQEIA